MLRDDELDREVVEKFSALTDQNKAVIVETLIESLFEQALAFSDRQLKNGVNQ